MTYSLGILGAPADNPAIPLNQDISDNVCATIPDEQNAMMLNTPFLVRGPDGAEAWYTYDAERSIPGQLRILKRVGP